MTTQRRIDKEIRQREHTPEYEYEVLLLEINRELTEMLATQGIRKTDLAKKLGVSRAFVTDVLRGETNLTIKTLVRFANALDCKVRFEISAAERGRSWEETPTMPRVARATDVSQPLGIAA